MLLSQQVSHVLLTGDDQAAVMLLKFIKSIRIDNVRLRGRYVYLFMKLYFLLAAWQSGKIMNGSLWLELRLVFAVIDGLFCLQICLFFLFLHQCNNGFLTAKMKNDSQIFFLNTFYTSFRGWCKLEREGLLSDRLFIVFRQALWPSLKSKTSIF